MKKKIKAMAKYGMKKKSTKAQTGLKKRTVISDTYDPSVEYVEGDRDYGRRKKEEEEIERAKNESIARATEAGYNTNRQKGGMMIEPSKEINFNSPNKMAKSGGLKGGQKKLDKNKDGKISGADFKMMKKGGAKKSYGGSTKMGGDMMQKGMGGMKTYKEGGVKNFKPHMMYDPKTGKSVKADTYAKHLELKKKGYGHSKTKKGMGGMKNYRS
tara:strand:- start:86 stop:724 length:639 start_codon:yes stop_codon:yes gene_type:complete